MDFVKITEDILNFIKKQAILSTDEIYGWLIGYQMNNIPYIITALDCQNYLQQSYINAIPDPLEIQKIGGLMPHGIGIIGIYHSHPFKSEVFHSHTDDETLISLSKQLPNCVSIVTNGKDINYYQMDKSFKLVDIDPKIWKPEIPEFLPIFFNNSFIINLEKNLLNNESLHVKIFNKFKDYLEENWDDFKLFKNNIEISYNEKINQYFKSSLDGNYLELKFKNKKNINELIKINVFNEEIGVKVADQADMVSLQLNLKSLDLFYITDKNSINELRNSIKIEIINNSIMPKIFRCLIDIDNSELRIPNELFLNLYGFFIKVNYYNQEIIQKLNDTYPINNNYENLSIKNWEFLDRMLKIVDLYLSLKIDKSSKRLLIELVENLIKLSKNHKWYDKIKKVLDKQKESLLRS